MRKMNRNFFKISFDSNLTRIHVNGTCVVAEIFGRVKTPTLSNKGKSWFPYDDGEEIAMENFNVTGKGIARLSSGDSFDYHKGVKIALAKAENNAYNNAAARIDKRVQELSAFVSCAIRFNEKVKSVAEHNHRYISEIGG